jgi:hypothetical protein
VVLFDRSGRLPVAPASQTLEPADAAREVSLSTFFWAMAFTTARKIARRQPGAVFGLLRMMHQARDRVGREGCASAWPPSRAESGSPLDDGCDQNVLVAEPHPRWPTIRFVGTAALTSGVKRDLERVHGSLASDHRRARPAPGRSRDSPPHSDAPTVQPRFAPPHRGAPARQ